MREILRMSTGWSVVILKRYDITSNDDAMLKTLVGDAILYAARNSHWVYIVHADAGG